MYFFSIAWGNMGIGLESFSWRSRSFESLESVRNILRNREVHFLLLAVPIQGKSEVLCAVLMVRHSIAKSHSDRIVI